MNNTTQTPDNLNPAYIFQAAEKELLIKLANGTLNAQELATKELANRGLDTTGKWVGFKSHN